MSNFSFSHNVANESSSAQASESICMWYSVLPDILVLWGYLLLKMSEKIPTPGKMEVYSLYSFIALDKETYSNSYLTYKPYVVGT